MLKIIFRWFFGKQELQAPEPEPIVSVRTTRVVLAGTSGEEPFDRLAGRPLDTRMVKGLIPKVTPTFTDRWGQYW